MKIILGLFVCFLISCGGSNMPPNSNAAPENKNLTDHEKTFITSSISYLTLVQQTDETLLITIAKALNKKAAPARIKADLLKASSIESKAYSIVSITPAPDEYYSVYHENQDLHSNHIAAFKEFQLYWDDSDISHINKGSEMLKTAQLRADSLARKLNYILKTKTS